MTNAQIVFNAQIELMNAGIIGTTGHTIEAELPDGSKITMNEPEPIHTYKTWQRLGYQVRRGEHAAASFQVWKYRANKKNEDAAEVEEDGCMFLTMAHFFTASQVDEIRKADPSEYVGVTQKIEIKRRKK